MFLPSTATAILKYVDEKLEYTKVKIFRGPGDDEQTGFFLYSVQEHLKTGDPALKYFDFDLKTRHISEANTYSDIAKRVFENALHPQSKKFNTCKRNLIKAVETHIKTTSRESYAVDDGFNNLAELLDRVFKQDPEFNEMLTQYLNIAKKIVATDGNEMDLNAVACMIGPSLYNCLYQKSSIYKYSPEQSKAIYCIFEELAKRKLSQPSFDEVIELQDKLSTMSLEATSSSLSNGSRSTLKSSSLFSFFDFSQKDNTATLFAYCRKTSSPFTPPSPLPAEPSSSSSSSSSLPCSDEVDLSLESLDVLPDKQVIIEWVQSGKIDELRKLFSSEKNKDALNAMRGICQRSLLHIAIIFGRTLVANLLINNGMQTLVVDSTGQTPLHYAVTKEKVSIVQLIQLSERNTEKSSINVKNKQGKTPFGLSEYIMDKQKRQRIQTILGSWDSKTAISRKSP